MMNNFNLKSFVYRSLKKIMPISNHIDEEHFFVKDDIYTATTLFVALVVIDNGCCFAIDSVPAILAITNDPFLVFSSNILPF
jgi:tellurite resistance protein TerC